MAPGLLLLFLLPRSGILEPDLGDTFAEPRDLCDSLEVLPIGVTIKLKVRL